MDIYLSRLALCFVCAAVGKVTTGFLQNLFQLDSIGINDTTSTILVFSLCGGLLYWKIQGA